MRSRDAPDVDARPIALDGRTVGTYWDFDSGIDFQGFPLTREEDEQNPGHYSFHLYAIEGHQVLGLQDNGLTALDYNNDTAGDYNIFTVTDVDILRLGCGSRQHHRTFLAGSFQDHVGRQPEHE